MSKILVAYTSRFGATAGASEAMAETLSGLGAPAEARPMQAVTDLSAYRAFVLGSAVNGGAWLPQALAFVQNHQAELKRRPCALFLTCMTLAMKNGSQHRVHVQGWLQPARALLPQAPVGEGVFAGALHIDRIPSWSERLKFRISVGLGVWQQGDHRDWQAIRAWAAALLPLLAA